MNASILFRTTAAALLTLTVAACGGSGSDGGGLSSDNAGPPRDSFFTAVNALVVTSPDTTEPREIESISSTFPEDAEPASLDS